MSDKQERLTEEQLDKKLEVFLENKATHHTAECTKKNYLAGKIDRDDLAEACMAMATTAMKIATTNRTQPTEIQKVMDMEEKWKETWRRIKAVEDPLEGCKSKMESAILAHQMSPMVAATATILLGLAGTESQQASSQERIAAWFSMFVEEACSSRLLAYNVQVAASVAGGMRQWRKVLTRLDEPLVPETERLAHLNCVTLEAAQNQKHRIERGIEGGGAQTTRPRGIFRTPPRDGSDPLEGGAPYAPIIGADGSQVAALDMSSFGALTEESQSRMQDTLTHLLRDQKTAPRLSNHTQGSLNYQNSGRGVGYLGKYRGNGGGNRHGNYRGGESQELFPSE